MDKLLLLAEALETTVDYLITGNQEQNRPLHNVRLLQRFHALESFNQEIVIKLIDAMILKHQVEGTLHTMNENVSAS